MTRFEFTKILRKTLSGRVSHEIVNENVAYYETYIDTEIKKGRSEREILQELGDPRLLAKTIIDTTDERETVLEDDEKASSRGFFSGRLVRLPVWLFMLVAVLAVILIFHVVGFVLSLVLPIAVPVAFVVLAVRYFRRK